MRVSVEFRLDINGLRAIAVLAVVLFHFNIEGFSGGFAGVDIFFVISGFLMTGIIFGKLDKGSFFLADFYMARCKRIIPALSVLCVAVMAVCWFILIPTDYESLGSHVLSSMLFISNNTYFNEINYFDADSHSKWLLHTWSLSVEWQFYIIYPIIAIALNKLLGDKAKFALAFLLLCSLSFSSLLVSIGENSEAFYLLPSRAWEMLAGGVAYFVCRNRKGAPSKWLHYLSLVGIIISVTVFSKEELWPGYYALIPVISSVAFIYACHDSFIVKNAISQFIGKISYSVYLWHWPIVVYLNYFDLMTTQNIIAGIISSLLLGWVSYECIEDPSRKLLNLKHMKLVPQFMIAAIVVSIPAYAGFYINSDYGVPSRYPFTLLSAEDIKKEQTRYWVDGDKPHPVPKSGDSKIVIIGNSHGIDLTYALTENGLKGDITYIRTTSSCSNFGLTANQPKFTEMCHKVYANVLNSKELADAEIVILHDNWAVEYIVGLEQAITDIRKLTKAKIYVVGPKMTFSKSPSEIVANAMNNRQSTIPMINDYGRKYYNKYVSKTDTDIQKLFARKHYETFGIEYISFLNVQCGKSMQCDLLDKKNKSFNYFDSGHFTLNGSIEFGKKLRNANPELFLQ